MCICLSLSVYSAALLFVYIRLFIIISNIKQSYKVLIAVPQNNKKGNTFPDYL